MGAHFEALIEGVLMAPLDSRYSQVGFNLMSVQVCRRLSSLFSHFLYHYASSTEQTSGQGAGKLTVTVDGQKNVYQMFTCGEFT